MESTQNEALRHWIHHLPKVELHVHLEGSIPHHVFLELLHKYDPQNSIRTPDAVKDFFSPHDFPSFCTLWNWKNTFLREAEDYYYIAQQFAIEQYKQNIVYTELTISPSDGAHEHLQYQDIIQAVYEGITNVPASSSRISLIVDLVRNNGSRGVARNYEITRECRAMNIVGIGLGGLETDYPASLFSDTFEKVKNEGFGITIHAGETVHSESIWSALHDLHADRIGHAVSAFQDEKLMHYLLEKEIPLELCIQSNVQLSNVTSVFDHPLPLYYSKGIPISINTDDPSMFNTTLCKELYTAAHIGSLSCEDIRKLMMKTVLDSFLPPVEKEAFIQKIQEFSI